jgi:hypothetical protein
MKTKIWIILTAISLMMTAVPCFAKNSPGKRYAVYPYEILPITQPCDNLINLSWEIDTSKLDPHKRYINARRFSVVLYGLATYWYGLSEPYTQVKDALVCLEYTTTSTSITLDLSVVQADVLNYIANMEGISVSEIQGFTFNVNAKVKGLCDFKRIRKIGGVVIEGPYSDPVVVFVRWDYYTGPC